MSKTVPELVKIERADIERVSQNVEPYPWQRANRTTKNDSIVDPFTIPTLRLPRSEQPTPAPEQDKKRR